MRVIVAIVAIAGFYILVSSLLRVMAYVLFAVVLAGIVRLIFYGFVIFGIGYVSLLILGVVFQGSWLIFRELLSKKPLVLLGIICSIMLVTVVAIAPKAPPIGPPVRLGTWWSSSIFGPNVIKFRNDSGFNFKDVNAILELRYLDRTESKSLLMDDWVAGEITEIRVPTGFRQLKFYDLRGETGKCLDSMNRNHGRKPIATIHYLN